MEQKLRLDERMVLTALQQGLPLVEEPFARMAQLLNQGVKEYLEEHGVHGEHGGNGEYDEHGVHGGNGEHNEHGENGERVSLGDDIPQFTQSGIIACINGLLERKYIRRVSGFFNSERMGYVGRLCGAKVREEKITEAAAFINAYNGVTHNYLRDYELNMWFTLQAESETRLQQILEEIRESGLVEELHSFKKDLTFKLRLAFDLGGGPLHLTDCQFQEKKEMTGGGKAQPATAVLSAQISQKELALIRLIQESFPIQERPFRWLGEQLGLTACEALELTKQLQEKGVLKRIAVSLYHQKVGYPINVMVVWDVKDDRIAEIPADLLACPNLTHCYTRTRDGAFPYNFYTMVHTRTQEEYEDILAFLKERVPADTFAALRTIRELKKTGMKY